MAHHTLKSAYASLTERLNRFPQGAPPSELLEKILGILFSEREARLVSLLPIKPFSAEKAAVIWKLPAAEAEGILQTLAERVITPLNATHRAIVMAIERGKLQHLIFDNHALTSHRAMAAILGVILKLPPLKQAMASRQMKSRYLEALIARMAE